MRRHDIRGAHISKTLLSSTRRDASSQIVSAGVARAARRHAKRTEPRGDVRQATISHLENGQVRRIELEVEQLADALNFEPAVLLWPPPRRL